MPYKNEEDKLAYITEWQKQNAIKVAGYKRKWKQANREKIREQSRQRRITVLSHYSDGKMVCNCCGDNHVEFLCVDHINGGGNKHRATLTHKDFYYFLVKENYPSGYRVLCHNCNASLGHYGYCPHQKDKDNETNKGHFGVSA